MSFATVSPDGRRVVTSPWRGAGVRVWDAGDGRLVKELPSAETAGVAFTPAGDRLLVLEADGVYQVYAAGSWEKVADRLDPLAGFARGLKVAFHPDGRTVAFAHDRTALRLDDLTTGEERAVLPVPESHNLAAYALSPDGRYATAARVRGAIQTWDLKALRERLRGMGLDWAEGRAGE